MYMVVIKENTHSTIFFFQELKDLGRPKRPMSSYILFAKNNKGKLKNADFSNYQSEVAKLWAKLSPEERMVFEEQAEELRAKYR